MKLLLEISYLGTAYAGYQVQENAKTVQGELNRASLELFGFACDITGCSRTDSGVHAKQFFCTVTEKGTESLETDIPLHKLPLAYCAHLPVDIRVNRCRWVEESFHARYSVLKKEYVYRIFNAPVLSPFAYGLAYHFPRPLDDKKMGEGASYFVGKHDFSAFMSAGSHVESTVRTVYDCTVTREGEEVILRISADGFLYNMVRIIAGTLLSVGEGKLQPTEISDIIRQKDREKAGSTLPPEGLYLNRVFYEDEMKISEKTLQK